jgi:uncharacterized membrane protein
MALNGCTTFLSILVVMLSAAVSWLAYNQISNAHFVTIRNKDLVFEGKLSLSYGLLVMSLGLGSIIFNDVDLLAKLAALEVRGGAVMA